MNKKIFLFFLITITISGMDYIEDTTLPSDAPSFNETEKKINLGEKIKSNITINRDNQYVLDQKIDTTPSTGLNFNALQKHLIKEIAINILTSLNLLSYTIPVKTNYPMSIKKLRSSVRNMNKHEQSVLCNNVIHQTIAGTNSADHVHLRYNILTSLHGLKNILPKTSHMIIYKDQPNLITIVDDQDFKSLKNNTNVIHHIKDIGQALYSKI